MPPRTSLSLLLILLSAITAPAQTPATIQARTNLVVVDAVVTDTNGNAVRGLKSSDFVLSEKGVPQQIRSFDEHSAATSPQPAPPPVDLPPGVFTNYAPLPTSPAYNVLLIDSLNTPLEAQPYLRQQLLSFLRSSPPGQRLAIFGLTTHLIYLQGFTSDPQLLRAAIDRKSIRQSQLLPNPVANTPAEQLSSNLTSSGADSHGAFAMVAANFRQMEAREQVFELQTRIGLTVGGLNQLARYLSTLPGRKNLVWFSGSFPLNVLPDSSLPDPFATFGDFADSFRDTANLLTRSQVAVYPVDARGLFTDSLYDPSSRAGIDTLATSLQQFHQQTIEEQTTMRQMAFQTGGHAFVNTNGLAQAAATALREGSDFYTVTYSPTDTNYNGQFRRIDLHLTGPRAGEKLNLAYRRGYFAFDPNKPVRGAAAKTAPGSPHIANTSLASATPPPPPSPMRTAMMRGAPEPTEIIFKARVLPSAAISTAPQPSGQVPSPSAVISTEAQRSGETPVSHQLPSSPATATPDPGTHINPDPKLASGPWSTYVIDLAAIASQFSLAKRSDGNLAGAAEFVAHVYNTDGDLIASTSNSVRLDVKEANLRPFLASGISFRQLISAPSRGDLYLRIGVHDLVSNRVGALELPLSAIKNLGPPPSPAPPPASSPPSNP